MTDLPESTPGTSRPETTDDPRVPDDGGAALDRAAAAIDEASEAEAGVAANDDITSRDDERAETHSEDPGVEDGS